MAGLVKESGDDPSKDFHVALEVSLSFKRSPANAAQEQLQQQPEVQEFLRQQGERHWETWLDTRLPALGNRTPRQAARTPDGRERLDALFAEFAWRGERDRNPMSPNVSALRAKLGLR